MEVIKQEVWKVWKDKPSRFRNVIRVTSQSVKYEDAIKEWVEIEEVDISSKTCICSHAIQDKCFIQNKYNGRILIVGNECIHKFGTDEMVESHQVRKNIMQYKGDKYPCENCGRHLIKKKFQRFCGPCRKMGATAPSDAYKSVVKIDICAHCEKETQLEERGMCSRCLTVEAMCNGLINMMNR